MKHKFTNQIKQAWLEALKSGQYVQLQNNFQSDIIIDGNKIKAHCCIAVLSDITEANHWNIIFGMPGGMTVKANLVNANDATPVYSLEERNYSAVIPIIESLPTEEE